MLVFRVEHVSTKEGPYLTGGAVDSLMADYDLGPLRHPEPDYDGLEGAKINGFVFGFANPDQLEAWFPRPLRQRMERVSDRFRVSAYEVPPDQVQQGRSQVTFYRGYRKPLFELPVSAPIGAVMALMATP